MSVRAYRLAAAGVLLAETALLSWNAWRFDWLRGYDAFANDLYADAVSSDLRLPSEAETGAWHTPPLWFALVGMLRRAAEGLGADPVQRPGQLLAAAAGLAVCAVVFGLARELWPERRELHLVALVLAASTPALVRASAMYHPETLAVALCRWRHARRRPRAADRADDPAGRGRRRVARAGGADAGVGAAGARRGARALHRWKQSARAGGGRRLRSRQRRSRSWGPWLVNQQVAHGDALAFNRAAPSEGLLERRPASFYVGPRLLRVFDHPVTPLFRNDSSRTSTPTGGATGR